MTPEEIHKKLKNIVILIDDSIKVPDDDPYVKKKTDEANETLKKYKLPDAYYAQMKRKK
jgi:hypothetical protein